MTNQFCPYCNQLCKKVKEFYICPIHGKVLVEREPEENKEEKNYIG
ncbi:MAG: hypothetical protein AABY22_24725 [Nanoarchaeota archaeon]